MWAEDGFVTDWYSGPVSDELMSYQSGSKVGPLTDLVGMVDERICKC